ncbi:hypothetical protein [Nonomuraea sp. GTA35]|uniref:hypothetical protein n=1 Tax=Nonomuraea sp. GTA35 TaxID=1676746 RepID=UPI0035C1CB43
MRFRPAVEDDLDRLLGCVVDDLLAEITRCHAGRGVQRIVADTDAGNGPMARVFERAGYRNFATRLVLSANPVNT